MQSQTKAAIRDGTRAMFERILVPVDGSPAAHAAARVAVGLADAFGGRVRFAFVLDVERVSAELTVWTGGPVRAVLDDLRAGAEASLRAAAEAATASKVASETVLLEGDVVEQLLVDATAWKADAVVIGTHSRGMALSPALGSKTAELLRRTTLPVLVVR